MWIRRWMVLMVMVMVLTACGGEEEEAGPELITEAVCEEGVGAFEVFVEWELAAIGPSGNDIALSEGAIWVVESGSNTVSRFDVESKNFESGFVDVGNDRNPYAAAIVGSEVWVANYLTNTVSVADGETGEILAEVSDERFRRPSAVAASESHIYVGNVNYISRSEGFGAGSVAVVDRASREVVGEFETEFKNPHFLSVEQIDGEETLLVSTGGAFDMDQEVVKVEGEGGLELYRIGENAVEPAGEAFALGQAEVELVGAPGRPLLTPDASRVYLMSGNAAAVFVFDVEEKRWIYDAADPFWLYDAAGDVTHKAAMGEDGLMWVTAFNEDGLYLLDTACDELVAPRIELGRVENMLEGPQAIRVAGEQGQWTGYFIYSIANALGRIRLMPTANHEEEG